MSNDRSRGAAQAAPNATEADLHTREPWYDRLLQALHLKPRETLREGLEEALSEPDESETGLSPLERAMLKNVLGLHKVRVDDVMIPRADIVAVSNETSLGDLLKQFRTAGHSRLPVYGETLDDPRGMVHIRDLVDFLAAKAEPSRRASPARAAPTAAAGEGEPAAAEAATPRPRRVTPRLPRALDLGKVDLSVTLAAARIQRPVLFVPPSMPAIDLLVRMQATRTHMALVIDEYGGTDGLISIEDLIEVVVGDIEDEHDVAEASQVQRVEGESDVFVADARVPLSEVSEATGIDLAAAVGDMAEEIDTLGGMIVTLAGRVPSRGELITGPADLEFEVLDADPRRLKRLRFQKGAARITAVVPLALPPPSNAPVAETPAPVTAGAGGVASRIAARTDHPHPPGIAGRIAALTGWRRLGLAWLAGALGAAAMPPYGLLPSLAASLSLAVWLTDGAVAGRPAIRRSWPAFLVGWAWGFGYLTAGLWWLGSAFLVDAEEFLWALPLGVIGLPFGLGLFYGAGFSAAGLLWSRGPARIAALGFGLAGAEWLRGHVLTGFPWNTLGMALGQNLWLMQGASAVGLYGLTVLAVLICAAPATLCDAASHRRRFGPPVLAAVMLAGLALAGAERVGAADAPVAGVRLRLVQPDIPQDAKFRPENRDGIVERYVALTQRPVAAGEPEPTHIIWPESAFPFLVQRDPDALATIAAGLQPKKLLMTGAARASEALPGERPKIHNAIMVIEPDGTITDSYDKVHLVPFGEYLPGFLDGALRAIGLRQFVALPGGFTAGSPLEQRILTVPGLPPVVATICYEAIFPGALRPAGELPGASGSPGLILNVTNDGWFGDTPGPRQHLAQARLRAVEEGLPLVRDANTGISAVIDPHGRIVAQTAIDTETVLDADLPSPLAGETAYARYGDHPFAVMLALCFGCALAGRRIA